MANDINGNAGAVPNGENVAQTTERLTRIATGVSIHPEDGMSVPFGRDQRGALMQYEALLDRPVSIKESAELRSVDSFIAYAKRHKTDESILLCDEDARSFEIIVDYHGKDGARWKHHRGALTLRMTAAMEAWAGRNNTPFNDQEEFALFLEENAGQITKPTAAEMLQIATEMRATKDVEFASKVNIDNGAYTFGYKEAINGTYKDGQTAVPNSFTLVLIPFRGMTDAFEVEAKLRYKVSQTRLKMWYVIPQLELLLDKAFNETRALIENEIGLPIFHGRF